MLAILVEREPQNGRAWRTLGQARQRLKDLDGATSAFLRALQVDPAVPTPYFSLGVLYAAKHDGERAFEWLAKAKATRKVDMTQIEVESALAVLKTDARFAALLPRPEDFQDPFVEPTAIIREWDGEAANDQFGWIARNTGDVDGDGIPDVVTSAPTRSLGGEKAGVASTCTRRRPARSSGSPMVSRETSWGPGSRPQAIATATGFRT
jgi:tetratricopeptide (TPR) repeat protein